jgi:hypothetical protein
MAAIITTQKPGESKQQITWKIGDSFDKNPHDIVSIQLSGDEQLLIPYPNKVHVITGTEAILYGAYIKDAIIRK